MSYSLPHRDAVLEFGWNEVSGAVGDAATVLPVVVAAAALTDLSLVAMLVWFGVFQVVWGLYYGVPLSVEPMKALAALVIAGAITTGELVVAGLLAGTVLLALGLSGSLSTVERYVGGPVVRGVQFGVALVLLETGVGLGLADPRLAVLAAAVGLVLALIGYRTVSALAVFLLGTAVAVWQVGVPAPAVPSPDSLLMLSAATPTLPAFRGALAQLAMTVGNAALATAVLLGDYFDRAVSADQLSTSMGAMNLLAVPLGAFPMCHGSGGVAGKYAFGARTAAANVVLGVGYVAVAVLGVGLVAAYPTTVLGVLLVLVALQLARTSLRATDAPLPVVALGGLGLVAGLGVAFLVGVAGSLLVELRR